MYQSKLKKVFYFKHVFASILYFFNTSFAVVRTSQQQLCSALTKKDCSLCASVLVILLFISATYM